METRRCVILRKGRASFRSKVDCAIDHFKVVYLAAKPLIWSEAEGDLVVIKTSIELALTKK